MTETKYQTHLFSFFISGEIFENFKEEFCRDFIELSKSRDWAISPPSLFLNDEEDDSFIIGGELIIFDAWREKIKVEDEIRNYYDVKILIEFLTDYSYKYSAEIDFEIEDEYAGTIENGNQSQDLSMNLMEEWQKRLRI